MVEKLEAEDPSFEILFDEDQIKERVSEIAKQVSDDYEDDPDTPLVLIGVLKGATPFFIDLFRSVKHPNIKMDFVRTSSYKKGEVSSGNPDVTLLNTIPIEGANIIVVDDIIDTGNSMKKLIEEGILPKNPKSLKVCALLSKPDRREVEIEPDYLGFEIDNLWVQGYGLDTEERGRNWPYIAYKKKV